jgi:hypothetical protein
MLITKIPRALLDSDSTRLYESSEMCLYIYLIAAPQVQLGRADSNSRMESTM